MAWFWWIVIAAVALIIFSIVRATMSHEKQKENDNPAIARLKEQLANDEISEEEYHDKKRKIKKNS